MDDEKPSNPAADRPRFPYAILWPGYGNEIVTLRELEKEAEEYEAFAEFAQLPEFAVPGVRQDAVAEALKSHKFPPELVRPAWLICCFYLAPSQLATLELDAKSSSRTLLKAAKAAEQLVDIMGRLSPKVIGAMYWIWPTIHGLQKTAGPPVHELHNETANFATVATAVASDLKAAEGRPRSHYRDTMFRLLLDLCAKNGLDDLVISGGRRGRPEPHLTGRAGELILTVIGIVEPGWTESWIAPRLKKVRAQMRRKKAGSKTRGS